MSTRTFTLLRDNTSRKVWDQSGSGQGRGTNDRLLVGKVKIDGKWRKVRSFLKWDLDWSGVEIVTEAVLTFVTANNSGDTELVPSDGARIAVWRLTDGFAEGSGGNWSSGDFEWPSYNTNLHAVGNGSASPDTTITVNMMELLRRVAPKRVAFLINGKKLHGLGITDKGFAVTGWKEYEASAATEVWSQEYGTASKRPSLEISYDRANNPPSCSVTTPSGSVTSDFDVTGSFTDNDPNDYMSAVQFQIMKNVWSDWANAQVNVRWSTGAGGGTWSVQDGFFDKAPLRKDILYKIRARVYDKHNKASDWSAEKTFTIIADAPDITAEDFGEVASMDGVLLGGDFTWDPKTQPLGMSIRVLSGSVEKWNFSRPIRLDERNDRAITQEYGGPALAAGDYTYQVKVSDKLGGESAWDTGTFTLVEDAVQDEDLTNVTGYSPVPSATRIVLRAMAGDRGPGRLVGIIENASNIGCSWYSSSPGELYFTLPVTHPQVSVCEPLVTHYSFEQFRRGRWKVLAAGILHDFHARDSEVVFYGMDYLGLLAWSIEAATQPTTNYKKNMPTQPSQLNGSRYFKKSIKYIIKDQLKRARRQDSNSPVKFIQNGQIGSFGTKITIYASYVQRLEFIRGLIESHKGAQTTGGGERRSRLRVRYNPANKRWVFDALDNVGSDRNNIRLEYGSLLQGYEVRAMGDYANLIYGAGKEPNKVKPQFARQASPGVSQATWGSIGRSAFWSDITDHQDLVRRTRAEAIRASRVGKQIALGLRVQGLAMWDGYDILDSIPIDIDDGVVNTANYGSGYWTIWGGEYRVYDDGHDEVTLIVRPKGDGANIDPDLIDSNPIHAQADWKWGHGAPTG